MISKIRQDKLCLRELTLHSVDISSIGVENLISTLKNINSVKFVDCKITGHQLNTITNMVLHEMGKKLEPYQQRFSGFIDIEFPLIVQPIHLSCGIYMLTYLKHAINIKLYQDDFDHFMELQRTFENANYEK